MKRFIAGLMLLSSLNAFAGERYLGTIAGTAGPTTKDNSNTASPFFIPPRALVTIQCDADAYVATDVTNGATATNGVKVGADAVFPTSVGTSAVVISSVRSAVISVIGVVGAVNCKVFERMGNE